VVRTNLFFDGFFVGGSYFTAAIDELIVNVACIDPIEQAVESKFGVSDYRDRCRIISADNFWVDIDMHKFFGHGESPDARGIVLEPRAYCQYRVRVFEYLHA
tara:strand:- start:112 stop:417 length:306 start_codon:yes stop_codon:yes gene_type:complete